MHLSDLTGSKDDIFAQMRTDPIFSPKSRKAVTLDDFVKLALKVVEHRAIEGAANLIREQLEYTYEMYTIVNGERPLNVELDNPITQDEWDSGLDDKVETLLYPYNDLLSNDWLGEHLTGTRLDETDAIAKFCNSFGKELYKQLCWQAGTAQVPGKLKSPPQILASAGIVTAEIEALAAERMNVEPKGQGAPAALPAPLPGLASLEGVAAKIAKSVGPDYDVDDTQGNVELVLEDDEILSAGAAQRLGLSSSDIDVLQMAGLNSSPREAIKAVMSALADAVAPMPAAAPPAKASKTAQPKEGALDPAILNSIQAHGGTPATALAVKLGVSRATYNNYLAGKTPFVPSVEQRKTLVDILDTHIGALMSTRSLLD